MNRVKIGQGALQVHAIVWRESTTDVYVLRDERDTVGHGREATDHHEVDPVADQPIEERLKPRQRGAPWPLSTFARPRERGHARGETAMDGILEGSRWTT